MTDREKIRDLIRDVADLDERYERIQQEMRAITDALHKAGFCAVCEVRHDQYTRARWVTVELKPIESPTNA